MDLTRFLAKGPVDLTFALQDRKPSAISLSDYKPGSFSIAKTPHTDRHFINCGPSPVLKAVVADFKREGVHSFVIS
ncbi:hypothetical protein ACTXT7_012522 [Hymenolepis weldensis]